MSLTTYRASSAQTRQRRCVCVAYAGLVLWAKLPEGGLATAQGCLRPAFGARGGGFGGEQSCGACLPWSKRYSEHPSTPARNTDEHASEGCLSCYPVTVFVERMSEGAYCIPASSIRVHA